MNTTLQSKAIGFLETERYAQLATVTADGKPTLRTMAYVLDNNQFAFVTDKRSIKFQQIQKNRHVSCLISRDHDDWSKSLQLTVAGTAEQETDTLIIERILSFFGEKYPGMKDMPPDPNLVVLTVSLESAALMDNSKGFLHVDHFTF